MKLEPVRSWNDGGYAGAGGRECMAFKVAVESNHRIYGLFPFKNQKKITLEQNVTKTQSTWQGCLRRTPQIPHPHILSICSLKTVRKIENHQLHTHQPSCPKRWSLGSKVPIPRSWCQVPLAAMRRCDWALACSACQVTEQPHGYTTSCPSKQVNPDSTNSPTPAFPRQQFPTVTHCYDARGS